MTGEFSIVQPSDTPIEQTNTSKTAIRKLTGPLGCTELRVNHVILKPGDEMTPHIHEGQEEVFIAQTDGQISIEREVYDVPQGGIVRVHPDTVRNLLNKTDDTTHIWLAFGAPPVGSMDDFGAAINVE